MQNRISVQTVGVTATATNNEVPENTASVNFGHTKGGKVSVIRAINEKFQKSDDAKGEHFNRLDESASLSMSLSTVSGRDSRLDTSLLASKKKVKKVNSPKMLHPEDIEMSTNEH